MQNSEELRRGKKGEVEEPGIMEPVGMALAKPCIFGKISLLFYLTWLLSPQKKKTT